MNAYIYDTVRTPRGKAKAKGGLASVKPFALLAPLYDAIAARNDLSPQEVDEVILGCVTQAQEQGTNIARVSTLYAGWPEAIPASTISTYCASGLSAVNQAAAQVHAGMNDLMIAGGVESVSRVPMLADKGPLFSDPDILQHTGGVIMGVAADLVATLERYTRQELDEAAVRSHHKAAHAHTQGYFGRSLIPVKDATGELLLDHDEAIRPSTSVEAMCAFPPLFEEVGAQGQDASAQKRYPQATPMKHLHHRGNSNSLADGAGLVLVGSKERGASLGLTPRAKIRAVANHAVDPVIMLTAIIGASEKALKRAGLKPQDIDLFESYESFSAVVLKYQRHFAIDENKFNVNGGAIAMGHAFGATGAMMLAVLLDELERRDLHLGLVTVCGAAGLGTAMILERV